MPRGHDETYTYNQRFALNGLLCGYGQVNTTTDSYAETVQYYSIDLFTQPCAIIHAQQGCLIILLLYQDLNHTRVKIPNESNLFFFVAVSSISLVLLEHVQREKTYSGTLTRNMYVSERYVEYFDLKQSIHFQECCRTFTVNRLCYYVCYPATDYVGSKSTVSPHAL